MTAIDDDGPTTAPVEAGEFRMLIDGELTDSELGGRFENINPSTGQVLGSTADGSGADMERAITAARRAFDETSWSVDHEFRRRCLLQLHDALRDEKEELRAELMTEAGAPFLSTLGPQIDWPVDDAVRWPAEQIPGFPWERELPDAELFGMTSHRRVRKEPAGVVGAICPWNFPVEILLNKLGPILATGNTCVVKPAVETPWTATRIGRLIAERTDIPAGVVNLVTSSDHGLGEQLVRDPRVDMISFTGSTATGGRIAGIAAPMMKRVFLELGGKSAMLVCDDADLETVVPGATFMCMHAGQGCALQTRLLVPRAHLDEAVEMVTAAFAGLAYGDPRDPANLAGPLISAKQRDRVLGHIERGRAEGARITTGGGVPGHLPDGYYVEPTVFADVDNRMSIAREEIFGPVLVVIPHDGDDDAVRIANDNAYGLSGGIFSASQQHGLEIARRLRVGSVMVNGGMFYGADSPYGGYKASGQGRQCGLEGLEEHLQTKSIGFVDDIDD
jgi:aldehyde dehydrogenase (NAD+)